MPRNHGRAVLFDLDRTLVDVQSVTDYAAALADLEELMGPSVGATLPDTGWTSETRRVMAILVGLTHDPRWAKASAVVERHELAAIPGSTPMPGLAEAMAATAGRPRAVVTLLPVGVAREVLDRHGAGDIDVVIGRRADQEPKPAPDGVLAACSALGVDPGDAVMLGDSRWDQVAAEAAGASFVGVTTDDAEFPADVVRVRVLTEALPLLDA